MPCMPPMRCIWRSWSARSSRSNWPLASLLAMRLGLGLVEVGGGLLDQGHDVALAEDAAGHAAGVEGVERVDLLAGRRGT